METSDSPHVHLAVDFGAGSGRVIAGILENGVLRLEEVHRFTNEGVHLIDTWHWQSGRQFADVLDGLKKAAATYGDAVESVGVDTWGVDYGLIDAQGRLLGPPVLYRDSRTEGMKERAFERMPAEELYRATGNQFMPFNTLFQLLAERERCPERLEAADRLLFMPDLFNYWLSGVKSHEATIASTSQLVDASTGEWATEVMDRLDIPRKLFGDIVRPGTVLGDLTQRVAETTGLRARVVAVGGHDTASAYAAVPADGERAVYLSSGTWSLLGTLTPDAVITRESFDLAFTNERAVNGDIRLLKNLCGMWILQECMRQWNEEGEAPDWDTLVAEAEAAPPFARFIDPDDARFATPGDMPARLHAYCLDTGQSEPDNRGALARMVYESLALKYRLATDKLANLVGHDLGAFHVVGGGSRNNLLNQFTANALNRRVVAGPVEATAAGNLLCQLQALGHLDNKSEGRDLLRRSFDTDTFHPQDPDAWEQALARFDTLLST